MNEADLRTLLEGVVDELPLGDAPGQAAAELPPVEVVEVAVLDDHLAMREGLGAVLAGEGIHVVCGGPLSAAGVSELLSMSRQPEIALVSVGAQRTGIPVAQRVAAASSGMATLLMTEGPADLDPAAALAVGASGIVWKGAPRSVLVEGIRAVSEGRLWLEKPPPEAIQPGYTRLSQRERRVLVELARGCTTEEAAASLHVSPHTLRTHVRNIQRKLGARTRVHALAIAFSIGEIEAL